LLHFRTAPLFLSYILRFQNYNNNNTATAAILALKIQLKPIKWKLLLDILNVLTFELIFNFNASKDYLQKVKEKIN